MFDLQLLFQCGSITIWLSRSAPEIHKHVVGTLSKQATNQQTNKPCVHIQKVPQASQHLCPARIHNKNAEVTCVYSMPRYAKHMCLRHSRWKEREKWREGAALQWRWLCFKALIYTDLICQWEGWQGRNWIPSGAALSNSFVHIFHHTDHKYLDIHALNGWMPATETHAACTIPEARMWLHTQWLSNKCKILVIPGVPLQEQRRKRKRSEGKEFCSTASMAMRKQIISQLFVFKAVSTHKIT